MSDIPGLEDINRGHSTGRRIETGRTPRVAMNHGQIDTKSHKTAPRLSAGVGDGRKLPIIPLAAFTRFSTSGTQMRYPLGATRSCIVHLVRASLRYVTAADAKWRNTKKPPRDTTTSSANRLHSFYNSMPLTSLPRASINLMNCIHNDCINHNCHDSLKTNVTMNLLL